MAVKAHGRIVFWEGASLWVVGTRPGEARYPRTALHSHHALQVTLALRGRFSFWGEGREVSGGAAAVAADAAHVFEGDGAVAHLFIDPDGREGRAIARRLFPEGRVVPIEDDGLAAVAAQLRTAWESTGRRDELFIELGRRLVAQLAGDDLAAARPDVRVRKMMQWALAAIEREVTLAEAAAQVGLSPGRARHLFVEQTGLPFRVYVLWLRLTRAVQTYASGQSLTEAAHVAGFADSAHLSRTFRRMFGISADSLRVF